MIIRPASTLGFKDYGWILSKRTFSNNSYWDPKYIHWKCLYAINDDTQMPGNMVPSHKHEGYDILGYMVDGELEHWDSLDNVNRAKPGQVQHMHCGSGIWHTEASVGTVPARYIQIWIMNKAKGTFEQEPYYNLIDRQPEFGLLPITFQSGMRVSGGMLNGQHTIPTKSAYIYVISGHVNGDGFNLHENDGAELDSDLVANFNNCHLLMFEQD